jgi:hypothetical protein
LRFVVRVYSSVFIVKCFGVRLVHFGQVEARARMGLACPFLGLRSLKKKKQKMKNNKNRNDKKKTQSVGWA